MILFICYQYIFFGMQNTADLKLNRNLKSESEF